jgi:hypothetical protein
MHADEFFAADFLPVLENDHMYMAKYVLTSSKAARTFTFTTWEDGFPLHERFER